MTGPLRDNPMFADTIARIELGDRCPSGWQASAPSRWVGENDPAKPPPGDGWSWHEAGELGQWMRHRGSLAWIDDLDASNPPPIPVAVNASNWRRIGYLVRLWQWRIRGRRRDRCRRQRQRERRARRARVGS